MRYYLPDINCLVDYWAHDTQLVFRKCDEQIGGWYMFDEFINTFLSTLALSALAKIWKIGRRQNGANRALHVLSHYTVRAVRRRHQRLPFSFYECIGGIIVPFSNPGSAHIDMDEVPHKLYKMAERLGKTQAKLGRVPNFDFNVKGSKNIYRVCTETDYFRVHTLVFYRRPRLLI